MNEVYKSKRNLRLQVSWFNVTLSVNDSLSEKENKKEMIMIVVPNHRKDVDMNLLLILIVSGGTLAPPQCWNVSEKAATMSDSSHDQREGSQMYTDPNPSCSTLINLISVASNDS